MHFFWPPVAVLKNTEQYIQYSTIYSVFNNTEFKKKNQLLFPGFRENYKSKKKIMVVINVIYKLFLGLCFSGLQ